LANFDIETGKGDDKKAEMLFDLCKKIEEMPNAVNTYQEKMILLRRINTLQVTGNLSKTYWEVLPRLCLGVLTNNFSVLWPETMKILSGISSLELNYFWDIFKPELLNFKDKVIAYISDIFQKARDYLNSIEPTEDLNELYFNKFLSYLSPEIPTVDYWNYENLLWKTLDLVPHIAERFSRLIVPKFFEFCQKEYKIDDLFDDEEDEEEKEKNIKISFNKTPKYNYNKMLQFLSLFSKFKNVKSLYKSKVLYDIYKRLLTKGDEKIQHACIKCLVTYQEKGIVEYNEKLIALTEDNKFRDELSTLNIEDLRNQIEIEHQKPLMEVIICLLYGKVISKKGRNSSRSGAKARRTAIFVWLAGCETVDIQYMMDLMFRPFDEIKSSKSIVDDENSMDVDDTNNTEEDYEGSINVPIKHQLGLLSVLEDFINQLKIKLDPVVSQIVNVVLKLIYQAENLINTNKSEDIHAILCNSNDENLTISKLRDVRQQGLRRLCQLFSVNLKFDFSSYMPEFFKRIITPRIPKFAIENTQAVTVIMEILRSWGRNKKYISFFVDYDHTLLTGLLSCLSAKKVHNTVVSLIIGILEDILHLLDVPEELAREKVRAKSTVPATAKEAQAIVDRIESELTENKTIAQKVLEPSISKILYEFEYLLTDTRNINFQLQSSIALWRRIVNVLSNISIFVTNGEHADKLIELLLPSLNKSVKIVPERTKEDILNITYNFLPLMNSSKKTEIELNGITFNEHVHFRYWSRLFMILESRKCRSLLCKIFNKLAEIFDYLKKVSELLDDLNAFSEKMIDEPDYDRRFDAYSKINQEYYKEFTSQQWLPIIYNLIYYLQTTDEFAIRTNSTYGITRLIERAEEERISHDEKKKKMSKKDEIEYTQFQNLVFFTCLPAIKRGIKSYKEEARHEFVTILGLMIEKNKDHEFLKDMVPLLANNDEEANFFNNIYHMQIHRRIRALKRLTDELNTGKINPRNISNIFVPIINHFIYESDKSSEHNLINEAINTIGVASGYLTWGQYYTLVKNTLINIKRKQQLEKVLIRVILIVLDNFHYDMKTMDSMEIDEKEEIKEEEGEEEIDEEIELIEEEEEEEEEEEGGDKTKEEEKEEKGEKKTKEQEKKSNDKTVDMNVDEKIQKPKFNKIHDTVVNRLIPELYNYLTQKDELNVIVRTPVALAIVKLLKNLPTESMNEQLPKLLLNLCQILKSRQQEARDSTRDTLVKIANLLGPQYFSFIVTELQTTLLRGYQLHVLGYTIHSLLYSLVPTLNPGDIDDCMEPLVDILINDIFGEVGDEREIEELRGKMREIKGTKSFDSFELLSKVIRLSMITVMLKPLKELMLESDSLKKMKNVEEILRRISVGLNINSSVKAKELLLFTHGLITETLPFAQVENKKKKELTQAEKNVMVQMKRPTNIQEPLKNFKANAYLFVEFGFSILLSGIKRDRISLQEQTNLEMIDPLIVSFGEALYSKHNKISILSMKILNTLIKAKIPKLKESWELIVKRLFQIIGRSRVTYNELIQNCFKLLISIIRDCYDVEITKFQLITLIKIIKIDLEEQENQSTTLSMIKAILARKYVVEEIYDLMNIVSNIIVTSQSTVMREQCRQIYITFLLDYPQSKNRLRNQISFFVNNLNYVYESGRVSVLEMLNLIISRFPDDLIVQFSELFFLSLVVCMINDDSSKCREMSGILIKQLIKRIQPISSQMPKIYKLLEKWTSPEQPKNIQQAAIQAYGLIIDTLNNEFKPQTEPLMEILCKNIIKEVAEPSININSIDFTEDETEYWELIYYSLNTYNKLINHFPQYIYSTHLESLWNSIQRLLLHPHLWIRISANRLFGIFFSKINLDQFKNYISGTKKISDDNKNQYEYLSNSIVLWRLCLNMIEELNSDGLTNDLSQQIVKNLFFAGRCLLILNVNETVENEDNEEENEANDENDKNAHKVKNPLMKIFRKLSYIARVNSSVKKSELMCISIYQWFAAMASVIEMPELTNYLPVMISSLYRSVQDVTNVDNEKVKTLAQEVLDLLQKRAGVKAFLEVYNSVHKHVQEVRKERHTKKVVQAIIDPEASARRKVQKNEMKKAGRKRKVEEITSKKLKTKLSIKRRK
jgi:U3 small nucleolar RNA-associated protein 20